MISEHKLRYELAMEPVQQLSIQSLKQKRFYFMYIISVREVQVKSNLCSTQREIHIPVMVASFIRS